MFCVFMFVHLRVYVRAGRCKMLLTSARTNVSLTIRLDKKVISNDYVANLVEKVMAPRQRNPGGCILVER